MATDLAQVIIRARDETKQAFDSFKSNVRDSGEQVSRLTGYLSALGVGLSAGYFVHLVKSSIDAADRLKDLSKSTNIAVEDLAGLRLLAKQTGTDLDGLAKGINRMSVEMGKDPEKFRALGITAKNSKEAFQQFADVFNLLPDIQQRNALAQAVFAKSWAELAPALSEGGQKIGEIIDKGARLSGVTKEMTDQADAFNDKWAKLTATGGLFTRMVAPLLPLLNMLADDLLQSEEQARGMNLEFSPLAETFRALLVLGGNVAFVFRAVGTEIGGIAAQMAAVGRGDFAGAAALRKELIEDAERARAAFDEWEKKVLEAGTTAAGNVKKILSDVDNWDLTPEAAAATARAAAFLKENKDVADHDAAYRGLLKTLKEKLLTDRELTEVAKLQLALEALGAKQRATITAAREKELTALAEKIDLMKREKDAIENTAKNEEALAKMRQEGAEMQAEAERVRGEAILAADRMIEQMKFETTLIQLTNVERETAIFLRQAEIDKIDAATIARGKEAIAAKHAAEEARQSQVGFWQSVESAGHQAFLSIFDTSKSVLERIRDMLKTHLIDILYQMTIKKWIINVAVATSGAGVAQSALGSTGGGLGSVFGGGDSLSSLFSKGSSFITGGADAIFQNLGTQFGSQWIADIGNYGFGLPFISGLAMAATGNVAGGIGSTLGGIAGSMFGPLGTVVGSTLGGIVGSMFGGDDEVPTRSLGDMGRTYGPGGGLQTQWQGAYGTGAGGETLDQLQARYAQAARAIGITPGTSSFYYGANTGAGGANPQFRLGGGAGGRWFDTGPETPVSDAALSIAASRAVLTALQGSDMPGYLQKYFDTLTAGAMDQSAIDGALQFAGALKQIYDQLAETTSPLEQMGARMDTMFADMSTSADTFKTDFKGAIDAGITPETFGKWQELAGLIDATTQLEAQFAEGRRGLLMEYGTEAQKAAIYQSEVTAAFEKMNIAVPESRGAFRALVDGLDLSTLAGQQMLASLIQISPAFSELNKIIGETVATGWSAAQIVAEQSNLQIRLLDAQGNATEALAARRALELAAMDESLRPLLALIYAAEDLGRAAADAAQLARTGADLDIRLLEAQGDAAGALAARRALELAAMDESLRPLLALIYAAEDLGRAAADAAQLARTGSGLQIRLLDAQGNASGALALRRALELAATDASLRGLLQQVWAQEDLQTATQAAAQAASQAAAEQQRAAEQLKNAWQSATESITQEVARIRGLMGSPEQSLAAAQAQFGITTAQARAGDLDAARLLPALSRSILEMALITAATSVDLQRLRGQISGSLALTAGRQAAQYGITLPSYATGADFISADQIAQIHYGERITPAIYNRSDATNAELLAEIKALRVEVAALRKPAEQTAANTKAAADTLDNVTGGGGPMLVEIAS